MHRRLHGRGALFDTEPPGLAPRLVGLLPHHHRVTPYEHDRDLPLVVLTGGRGLGKTAVLDELRDAYRGHTPTGLIDCEDPQFERPPSGRAPESWSPVSQALLVLAEQLAEPVTGAGRLVFPRLMSGLVAVAAGGWGNASDSDSVRREVERILLLNETRTWGTGFAGRWASKMAVNVAAAATGGGLLLSSAVEAALEALQEGFTGRRRQKEAAWYRDYPNASDNPQRGLLLLSNHFVAGGTSRVHAERYLVRALLADLSDAYTGVLSRMQRLGRPLILVDNAQSAPGWGLLDPVLRDRADGVADRTVFIAALRGTGLPGLRNAPVRPLPEVARSTAGWAPGTAPSSRALLVRLTPLSADHALHVVDENGDRAATPPAFAQGAHRLTGGNPLGITLLAVTAAQHGERAASFSRLLTSEVTLREDTPARHAYRALLDRLVPRDRLDELTVLAAAHDHESACALAAAQLPETFGPSEVRELQERLAAEGLPTEEGEFVGDRFARTLLLLRLHHRDADHRTWREVHETLIRHYAPAADPADPIAGPADTKARYRLHHELALGDTSGAVAYLRDSFWSLDTRAWLATLRFVASAPYFHAHDADGHDLAGHDGHGDHRAAVALGRVDTGRPPHDGPDDALHLRVRRLLHAVWQLTDPLVLPDPRVGDRLRFELEQLSNLRPAGNALLWRASRDWPADALAGRPLRTPRDEDDTEGDA